MSRAIGLKKRFEVFKRDNFTCQYCSAKPPKVPLEVDHVIPVCKGGDNTIDNLITSCFDCNRGKGGNELTSIPETVVSKIERMKIAKKQYKQYQKLLNEAKQQIESEIKEVEDVYTSYFDGWEFSTRFRISVKNFINKLGVDEVVESMEIACSKINNEGYALKYFCGICWAKIKER